MTKWALQDAKAQFSRLVREADKGPQTITLRGEDKAVLLSAEEYRRLKGLKGRKKAERPMTLYDALRSCPHPFEIPRMRGKLRPVDL